MLDGHLLEEFRDALIGPQHAVQLHQEQGDLGVAVLRSFQQENSFPEYPDVSYK